MSARYDVAVVGAGLAGAASAWGLTRRGHSVILLEARPLGHTSGSSHGSSRIYRRAYPDAFYVDLTGRAEAEWNRLEAESGVTLRVRTGGINSGSTPAVRAMADLLAARGVPAEMVDPAEAAGRWPGMTFDAPVMFHPDAGYLDPDRTIRACVDLAVAGGAVLVEHAPVTSIRRSAGGVTVSTATAEFPAGQVVISAGGWLPELLPSLHLNVPVPPLTVKQQEVFHFRRRDPSGAWPTLVHKAGFQLYGLPSGADGGAAPAMKIGQFDSISDTSASGRDGVIDPRARGVVRSYVERTLPGLDPEVVAEQSCLFTMTPDEDFLLDRAGDVVVASPCSGHGAKFAPLTGVLIADLVEGRPAEPRFAFRR